MKQKSGNQSNHNSGAEAKLTSIEAPQYPPDDGLPTLQQMEAIDRLAPQDISTKTMASLF